MRITDIGTYFPLVFVFVLLYALVGWAPGAVARRNQHPNASGVSTLGFIGLIVWPCWIAAIVWAFVGAPPRK